MIKILFLNKLFFLIILMFADVYAKDIKSFDEGQKLFEIEKYEDAKFFFERDIVFNPKQHKSYLYLAKIYKKNNNDEELENNLNSVLLLSPNNEEAIYLLILLKIKQSNYIMSSKLIEQFKQVCNLFCLKELEIKSQLNKINPDNENNKN